MKVAFSFSRSPTTARKLHGRRGVALVITLVMLSVITFMAVTFLVLSRRERNAVAGMTDQAMARDAVRSATDRAEIEIISRILAFTNDQAVGLIVSTNYINDLGYDPTAPLLGGYNPTNVNYAHLAPPSANQPVTGNNFLQNLRNLQYNPRAPVFVRNRQTGGNDFPYYNDLNRNGIHDTNGFLPVISGGQTNGEYGYFVGDPEWIGVLEHPEWPHSSSNRLVSRYSYLVVPTSLVLDVNYIFNQANQQTIEQFGRNFRRNEGAGSWEINLPAFLFDLNTNAWGLPYDYDPLSGTVNGNAFADAAAILRYRYGVNYGVPYTTLQSMGNLFGAAGAAAVSSAGIDHYSDGAYQTNTTLPLGDDNTRVAQPWVGADNPNHLFTPEDFFNPAKTSVHFVNQLKAAGTNIDSNDRYIFYRMLAQLGTDSAPDRNKMNLNYRNMANGTIVPGMETNFLAWTPLDFFTNAAQLMFVELNITNGNGTLLTVTNIEVYPLNFYTPAVHRILQLAANMFEATTNGPYPSIYRPYFTRTTVNGTEDVITITGYELVNGPTDTVTDPNMMFPPTAQLPLDLNNAPERALMTAGSPAHLNAYGVPWVIGARKGFPNLNQVVMQINTAVTRRIQATNTLGSADGTQLGKFRFTQLMEVGISNVIGVGVWNSYFTNYPRAATILANGRMTVVLSNAPASFGVVTNFFLGGPVFGKTNIAANRWSGTGWYPASPYPAKVSSFVVPLLTNCVAIPYSTYRQNPPGFVAPVPGDVLRFDINGFNSFPTPQWEVYITNRLRCMVLDSGDVGSGRLVDYAQIGGMEAYRNLSQEAKDDDPQGLRMWSTGATKWGPFTVPEGVANQINIAMGNPEVTDDVWSENGGLGERTTEINKFKDFINGAVQPNGQPKPAAQIPFTPTSRTYQNLSWQANDPLVHYLSGDLYNPAVGTNDSRSANLTVPSVATNLYSFTDRYSPWGGNPKKGTVQPEVDVNTAFKDPLMWSSDSWDFPTNKLPNLGWLGRIHRGTPWQTMYLKASDATTNIFNWMKWTGARNDRIGHLLAPTNDWRLLGLFTVGINDNATRGRLSVNQSGLAAWSAVLSGVIALTNSPNTPAVGPFVIQPAGIDNRLARIVQAINQTRASTNIFGQPVFRNRVFNSVGEVFATPELTERSPFLDTTSLKLNSPPGIRSGINDEVMERIPQEILSLLTVEHSPRFVIYAYGQTLRPAENSVIRGGPYSGLCTNYQVTAETATRTVVRVEGSPDPANIRPDLPPERRYPPRLVIEQFNILPPD